MSLKEKILYFLNHNSYIKPKEQVVLFYIIIFLALIYISIKFSQIIFVELKDCVIFS